MNSGSETQADGDFAIFILWPLRLLSVLTLNRGSAPGGAHVGGVQVRSCNGLCARPSHSGVLAVKEMGAVVRSCVYPEGKFLPYLLIENEKMRKSIKNFAWLSKWMDGLPFSKMKKTAEGVNLRGRRLGDHQFDFGHISFENLLDIN